MTEMMEAILLLHYASKNSLILFDEIGRGTATYDGMALAQAMIEYINSAIQAKTLFSTRHLRIDKHGKKNRHQFIMSMSMSGKRKRRLNSVIVISGKADKSYGINVARLAHLPKGLRSSQPIASRI